MRRLLLGLVFFFSGQEKTLVGMSLAWREMGDAYDGVSVDAGELDHSVDFESMLGNCLTEWKRRRRRGIWLRIPISRAQWIPQAVSHEFEFHHAERDHVVMTTWLADEANQLPPNASHQVGVGAVVLDSTGRLALVKERFGKRNRWKVPTGLVEARETISDAVVREVREEIGLTTRFVKVVAVKHSHSAPFGKSDAFFLCLLRLVDENSFEFKVDPLEIADATWSTWNDFRTVLRGHCSREWMALYDLCDRILFSSSPSLGTDDDNNNNTNFIQHTRLEGSDTVIYSACSKSVK